MRRFHFALPIAASALLLGGVVACGGDSKDDEPTAVPGTPTLGLEPSPTKAAPRVRETPTATPNESIALAVGGRRAGSEYAPTVAEFRALPTATVKGQTGVTLGTLVAKAGKGTATIATIDGTASGGAMGGAVRKPIDEIASTTIFVMDEQGHIKMVSDTFPETEWLTVVTNITLE